MVGGTSPYQYSKDGIAYTSFAGSTIDITAYNEGTHTVYVKDVKGCVATKTIIVERIKYPIGDVVAVPTFSIDASGTLKIKTSIKNTGNAPFVNPFKIVVYKNTLGNAKRYVYTKTKTVAVAETSNIEI